MSEINLENLRERINDDETFSMINSYLDHKTNIIRAKAYSEAVEVCHKYALKTVDPKALDLIDGIENDILNLFDKKAE